MTSLYDKNGWVRKFNEGWAPCARTATAERSELRRDAEYFGRKAAHHIKRIAEMGELGWAQWRVDAVVGIARRAASLALDYAGARE